MRRAARGLALAAALGGAGVAGCTQVGTNPESVVSIVADTTPVASVIVGDTLRDSLGNAFPLRRLGRAYNPQGAALPNAAFSTFLTPLTTSALSVAAADSARVATTAGGERYLVVGQPATNDTTGVDVSVQYAPGLRITRRFYIVPRPETIAADSTSVTRLVFTPTTATRTATVAVHVRYDSAGIERPARYALVRFDAAIPFSSARIASVRFVEPGRVAADSIASSRVDTVDVSSGIASRQLVVTRRDTVSHAGADSFTVSASVLLGAPLRRVSVPFTVVVVDSAAALAGLR